MFSLLRMNLKVYMGSCSLEGENTFGRRQYRTAFTPNSDPKSYRKSHFCSQECLIETSSGVKGDNLVSRREDIYRYFSKEKYKTMEMYLFQFGS